MRPPAEEFEIVRERAAGNISTDESFERLYALYAPMVRNWTRFAADTASADDLFQDTWFVFYSRWRGWSFPKTPGEPTGRPVLAFLYRTLQHILRAYRRKTGFHENAEELDLSNGHSHSKRIESSVEFGRLLEKARHVCSAEELDVLLAKLAGLRGSEIAESLGTTTASVDHRFRNALSRLQKHFGVSKPRRSHHGK